MTFFVISVLTLNIILWIVLLIRFKKLFSTDQIIENTRETINRFIKDVDSATARNTYLTKEMQKRLEKLLEDADARMEMFKEAANRLRDMIAQADRINKGKTYTLNPELTKPKVDPEAAYELNIKSEQGSLFDQTDTTEPKTKSIQKNVTNVTEDGAAYREIPLIITKVFDEEPRKMTQEEIKKNLEHLVRKLFNEGNTVEQIAQKLNCSITEIQFIIDMF